MSGNESPNKGHVKNRFGKSTQYKWLRNLILLLKQCRCAEQKKKSKHAGSHVDGLPSVILEEEGYWDAHRSTLSADMIKYSKNNRKAAQEEEEKEAEKNQQ